jgi:hypothetical protein
LSSQQEAVGLSSRYTSLSLPCARNVRFFQLNTRSKLRSDAKKRREVILTMVKTDRPLLENQISKLSGVHATYIVQDLVRCGFAKLFLEKHGHVEYSRFGLTDPGILFALAVSYESKQRLGRKLEPLLIRILEHYGHGEPLASFSKCFLLNAFRLGLQDYVLRYIRNAVKEIEHQNARVDREKIIPLDQWIYAPPLMSTEARDEELPKLNRSLNLAIKSMEEKDVQFLCSYAKNSWLQWEFSVGRGLTNIKTKIAKEKIMELALRSEKDPNGMFLPFVCPKCNPSDEYSYWLTRDILIQGFTKRLQCLACKSYLSILVSEEENRRLKNQAISPT